jgi:hypothetical protein
VVSDVDVGGWWVVLVGGGWERRDGARTGTVSEYTHGEREGWHVSTNRSWCVVAVAKRKGI